MAIKMSLLFTKCEQYPQHVSIDFLLNTIDDVLVKEKFKLVKKAKQCVPKDLWILILRNLTFKLSDPTPALWHGDFVKWFLEWNSTPELHELNPLVIVDNSFIDYNNPRGSIKDMLNTYNTFGTPYQAAEVFNINEYNNKWYNAPFNSKIKIIELTRDRDIFCGLVISDFDINYIESIEFVIGSHIIPTCVDLKTPIKQKIGDSGEIKIYQPKDFPFIPLISLAYHMVQINITFKKDTESIIIYRVLSNIKGIFSNLTFAEQRILVYPTQHFIPLNSGKIVRIADGMCELV